MLNKLFYYKNGNIGVNQKLVDENFIHQLVSVLGKKDIKISQIQDGTLGLLFKVNFDNKNYVLKTHLDGKIYKETLLNEFELLKCANISSFYCELINISENKFGILMEYLDKNKGINPVEVYKLINDYQKRLDIDIKPTYTFENLISTALSEIQNLIKNNIISSEIGNIAKIHIDKLKEISKIYKNVICHGDLSNKNIMQKTAGEYAVIDFEDAFWGIEGYDYLYWLTFFSNRKFYSKENFYRTTLNKDATKSMLMLILILKAAIALYSGSYKSNSMTDDERIREILNILD